MKNLLMAVGGAVVAALYVVVVGLLSVQVIGLRAGAVFDLGTTVVGVTEPRPPVWPLLAITVLSALVLFGLVVLRGAIPRHAGVAFVAGCALAATALVVWAFALSAGREAGADPTVGVLAGWVGWVEKDGLSSAVHLVVVLAVASLAVRPRTAERPAPAVGGGRVNDGVIT